ncbi:ZIP metal ion transporter-like protein [Endogone sp. FLAS-F59071]|nr:ZIP metal ion transporter-like protein [Endogone sp. FLAS-F59071]|eukprot:RUS16045.1 ZIP metal ion transporter-like protein [Endogone sp. FLAS-F59071]
MLIGSFVAGMIPLAFKLSEERLRLISALGVGLLMGTALIVIIPEGIETIYSVPDVGERSISGLKDVGLHTRSPHSFSPVRRTAIEYAWSEPDQRSARRLRGRQIDPLEDDIIPSEISGDSEGASTLDETSAPLSLDDHETHGEEAHRYIGLALILGFSLMFLIDQFSSLHMTPKPHRSVSLPDFTELDAMLSDPADAPVDPSSSTTPVTDTAATTASPPSSPTRRAFGRIRPQPARARLSPTVGLVVHAAADGIALGASASHPNLSFIVFLAIMLHKAPAAFGLTTVLLREGYTRHHVRRHLATFSLAAPSGALVTYVLLAQTGVIDPRNMQWWTGMLLLFSGGTFLYVAMHVLEEVQGHAHEGQAGHHGHKHGEKGVNGGGEGVGEGEKGKMSYADLACVTIGMFLPLLLNVEHGH